MGSRESGSPSQAWLRAKARLAPDLLPHSPPWVRGVFDHAWAPMQALEQQVGALPPALCTFLAGCPGGVVWIHPGRSEYRAGSATLRGREVENVAYVSVLDLARDNERPLHVIGHLVDHYLGAGGTAAGAWLSAGGGLRPRWRAAGARLPRLFALGYGPDEVALANVRDYFAQSLALYCRERQRLNVADPQITRWLRSTLWSAAFWQEERKEETFS